jgi:hypothetical protein
MGRPSEAQANAAMSRILDRRLKRDRRTPRRGYLPGLPPYIRLRHTFDRDPRRHRKPGAPSLSRLSGLQPESSQRTFEQ